MTENATTTIRPQSLLLVALRTVSFPGERLCHFHLRTRRRSFAVLAAFGVGFPSEAALVDGVEDYWEEEHAHRHAKTYGRLVRNLPAVPREHLTMGNDLRSKSPCHLSREQANKSCQNRDSTSSGPHVLNSRILCIYLFIYF